MTKTEIIQAFTMCDNNYTGDICKNCPYRDTRWNGSWEDDDTDCISELKQDILDLLNTIGE